MIKVSFYCRKCRLDEDLPAIQEENSYGKWFESKCPGCKGRLLRNITEKELDPYWHSPRMRMERAIHAKDILQPGQDGFMTYYKDSWNKIERATEEWESIQKKKKKERDEYYANSENKNFAKKVISYEENGTWMKN